LREQSALILAPAATPSGSKLSNSPFIGVAGTRAFQIPSASEERDAPGCALAMAAVAANNAENPTAIQEFGMARHQ
jgi:hypothetical protein